MSARKPRKVETPYMVKWMSDHLRNCKSDYESDKDHLAKLKKRRKRLRRLLEEGPAALERLEGRVFAVESEVLDYEEWKSRYLRAVKATTASTAAASPPPVSAEATN